MKLKLNVETIYGNFQILKLLGVLQKYRLQEMKNLQLIKFWIKCKTSNNSIISDAHKNIFCSFSFKCSQNKPSIPYFHAKLNYYDHLK